MCGIAGVVVWDEKYRVTRETLAKMSAAIAHRGPDGEGLFITREHEPITPETPQVAFAFRRLAILDCDERAMQPMHTPDGRYTIVFNGEIYNFRELREELRKLLPEYVWRTTGDTEVLLMSYATWGESCVEKLNGMFAFVAWDHQQKQLFLARDRMGQKPLYQHFIYCAPFAPVYAFASELNALKPLAWMPNQFDDDQLVDILRFGVDPDFHSAGHPHQLEPGVFTTITNGTQGAGCMYFEPIKRAIDARATSSGPLSPVLGGEGQGEGPSAASARPWGRGRPSPLPSPPSTRERGAVSETRRRTLHAVERQLISDVPLGVFLSGGIDSSVIAACARKFGPVQTFSIGVDDPRYDESIHAAAVAKHLGTTHHAFKVTPDAASDLPRLAALFGEPFADSSALPTYYLAHETRKHVTVALSGDGGDELFGGYDRYRAIEWSEKLRHATPHFVQRRLARFSHGHSKSRLTRVGRLFRSLPLPIGNRYASYLQIFADDLISELLGRAVTEQNQVQINFDGEIEAGASPAQAAAATDRLSYLPDDLLTKVDRCSMAHGLEVRSPFMDHELVQFAAGLTTDQLLRGGPKRMLREAFADDLPAWVFKRKKMGFAVPIGEWFRGPLRSMLRDNLFASDSFAKQHFQMKVVERLVDEHETKRVYHSQRLYALLMLELWWKLQP